MAPNLMEQKRRRGGEGPAVVWSMEASICAALRAVRAAVHLSGGSEGGLGAAAGSAAEQLDLKSR